MKTIITVIAAGFILNTNSVNAQSVSSMNETMTVSETKAPELYISDISFRPLRNGYNVTWETNNQFNVAAFELQISENGKNFSTVKRRTCGPEKRSRYQVQLNNTIIFANPVYYRLKWVTMDGEVKYTESKKFENNI